VGLVHIGRIVKAFVAEGEIGVRRFVERSMKGQRLAQSGRRSLRANRQGGEQHELSKGSHKSEVTRIMHGGKDFRDRGYLYSWKGSFSGLRGAALKGEV
jgi:hypothetical protein